MKFSWFEKPSVQRRVGARQPPDPIHSEMMKCFVMHGIGKVGVMEKPIPRPGPSDAIIRTTAALICTSDSHTVAGAIGDRHGLTLGHEAVGVSVTRPGGTISNVGYHGDSDSVPIPREAWGVGMSDKTIRTALCPGGSERMSRLLRLIEAGRVDPLSLTTHRFRFSDIEKTFRMMQTKEDGMIQPLISFA